MEENDKKFVKEVSKSTSNDFEKRGVYSLINRDDFENMDELREYLANRIINLLDRDYDRLLNALYLIDVSEDKFHDAFKGASPDQIPYKIADLVIEREIQKVHYRQKYKRMRKQELE